MIEAFVVFLVTVTNVFALGFQSQNVNHGHYVWAACTSTILGFLNLFLFRSLPNTDSIVTLAAYIVAGPVGILLAMLVFRRYLRRNKPPA